ncbi:MAG TPA: hypothetical protein VNP92_18415 [Actinophytocola sp.]|nr:hypothetical protein [Actinophytocola sp.]
MDEQLERHGSRRMVIVGVVVFLVVAAVAVVAIVGLSDSSAEPGAAEDFDQGGLPVLRLPAGCDLLTPGQVSTLVPQQSKKIGRGPELVVDAMESACDWSNSADGHDERQTPSVALGVKATSEASEEEARSAFDISLPCNASRGEATNVSGADEACVVHNAFDEEQNPAAGTVVSARFETLVVEVAYRRADWPAWRVADQCAVTAAALIGAVLRDQ